MKSSNTISKRLTILLLVLVVVAVGGGIWWKDAIVQPDPSDVSPVIFVVNKGESVRSITTRLAQQGLIRNRVAFYILVKTMGLETQLQAGDFRLNRAMNAQTVAGELTHGTLDVWVTTLEGWRAQEIATKIAKELDIPEGEFLKYAREGYLFPDTYLIPRDASAAAIIKLFEDTFNAKVTPKMRQDALKTGLSFSEVITLASIVEREGRTDEDRPVIAGILLQRLKAGWPLQADATLQYALGYQSLEKSWWKRELTVEDKQIKSSYNTYLHPGLPPGPIANPGLAAISAVIYPQETSYWYYLHDSAGGVHYATTIEEHEANIARYLQ